VDDIAVVQVLHVRTPALPKMDGRPQRCLTVEGAMEKEEGAAQARVTRHGRLQAAARPAGEAMHMALHAKTAIG